MEAKIRYLQVFRILYIIERPCEVKVHPRSSLDSVMDYTDSAAVWHVPLVITDLSSEPVGVLIGLRLRAGSVPRLVPVHIARQHHRNRQHREQPQGPGEQSVVIRSHQQVQQTVQQREHSAGCDP